MCSMEPKKCSLVPKVCCMVPKMCGTVPNMTSIVPKMWGMGQKMRGMVQTMCGRVPKCAAWGHKCEVLCRKCAAWCWKCGAWRKKCEAWCLEMVLPVIKQTILTFFREILNLEGHQNRCIALKVTSILLNGWIFPTGGVASRRVCACSLRNRLVSTPWQTNFQATAERFKSQYGLLKKPEKDCFQMLEAYFQT